MYLVKKTFRKNKDAQFFEDGAFDAYQQKMYRTKWSYEHKIVDSDTLRHIHVWPTEDIYQRWANDPTVLVFVTELEKYNKENSISCNEIHAKV